ncbi:hypothetical protein E2320_022365 [Naja naja]|nr:hypothetical protein E2320_022365 [Naja naja]
MAPSHLFLLSQLPRRRACQLWGLALASLAPIVLLFLSWHWGSTAPTALWKLPLLQATPEPVTVLTDGTFTFYLNRSVYKDLFPYLQVYQCREVIAQDGLCQGPSGAPLLLLAIKSHPVSSGRRATLRRTWARPAEVGGFWLQPLFLMGVTSSQKQLELAAMESRALTDYLHQTPNASRFIHGNIQHHSKVLRSGKYAVSRKLYPLDHYPNFASGGGFIMAQQGLPALYRASLVLPVFPLDDVYLAFLALVAQIPHRHDDAFHVWGIPKDELSAYQKAISIHGVSMERMEEVSSGLAAVLFIVSALWKLQQATLDSVPALTDDTFTFYLNWSVYKGLFPYLQVYQCREVIAQDRLCQGPSQAPLLLLAIKSHLASGGRRATLRRTWAQPAEVGGFWLQPLFLLGVTSSQKQVKLAVQESHAFGDILMFLRRTPNASHFIHGHVHYHPAVKRIGRDAIPFLLFPLAHYPHFALEKGFLVPGAALPALYQASLWLPTFPLSGAYWGFLALAIQLPHRHSGDFRAWEKMNNHLTFYRESLLVHGISMERMEEVWQELRGSVPGWPK